MGMTEVMYIPPAGALDGITVYWHNYEVGRGMVTLVCWGSAWNCYFGGMPEHNIQTFFSKAGTDYLCNKLGCTQWLKQTKQHEKYLERLIDAIKGALREKVQ